MRTYVIPALFFLSMGLFSCATTSTGYNIPTSVSVTGALLSTASLTEVGILYPVEVVAQENKPIERKNKAGIT